MLTKFRRMNYLKKCRFELQNRATVNEWSDERRKYAKIRNFYHVLKVSKRILFFALAWKLYSIHTNSVKIGRKQRDGNIYAMTMMVLSIYTVENMAISHATVFFHFIECWIEAEWNARKWKFIQWFSFSLDFVLPFILILSFTLFYSCHLCIVWGDDEQISEKILMVF